MADFQLTQQQKQKVGKISMRSMSIYKKWIIAALLTGTSTVIFAQKSNDNNYIEDEIIYKKLATSITPPLETVFDRESGQLVDVPNIKILSNNVSFLLNLVYPDKSLIPPECIQTSWTLKCIDKIDGISNKSPEASYVMAILYDANVADFGYLSNHSKALSYMENAAAGGLPNAEYLLSRYVANGSPGLLEKDAQRASNLIKSSAQKGYLSANLHLALDLLRSGQDSEAFEILVRVKDKSHDASFMYATAKLFGRGADRNLAEARSYFERLNSDKAIYNASVMMLYGLGGEQNVSKAMVNLEMLAGSRNGVSFEPAVRNIGYFRLFSTNQNIVDRPKIMIADSQNNEVDINCPEVRKKRPTTPVTSLKEESSPFVTEIFIYSLPWDGTEHGPMGRYTIEGRIDAKATFQERIKREKPVATCTQSKVTVQETWYENSFYTSKCANNFTGTNYFADKKLYMKSGKIIKFIEKRIGDELGGNVITLDEKNYKAHQELGCLAIIEDKSGNGYCWPGGGSYSRIFTSIELGVTPEERRRQNDYGISPIVDSDGKWRGGARWYRSAILSEYQDVIVLAAMRVTEYGFYCDVSEKPKLNF